MQLDNNMGPEYSALAPRQRGKFSGIYNRWVEDGWLLEALAAVFGVVLIIVLCVILRDYQGQPIPSLGSVLNTDVTLNFVVSLLLSFAVPALMFPVAECLGQFKWIWFSSGDRSLEDLNTFDRASRGTLGGAAFLWKLRARPFASLGAFLAVVQLAIGPLAQNALIYPSQSINFDDSTNATVQTCTNWREPGVQTQLQLDGYDALSLGMKGAIQTGLFSGNTSVSPTRPSCSSGNCTIGPYQSLAVCSSLADITASLTNSTFQMREHPKDPPRTVTRYSLPGGHFLQVDESTSAPAFLNFTSATLPVKEGAYVPLNFSDSVAFKNLSAPIADVFFIYQNPPTPTQESDGYSAVEFVLDWCVQTLNTSVTNGIPTTLKLDEFHNFDDDSIVNLTAKPNAAESNQEYTIGLSTHFSLQRYLLNLLNGNVTGSTGTAASVTSSDVAQALYMPFTGPGDETVRSATSGFLTTQAGLKILVENVAMSMTNQIRNQSESNVFRGTVSHQQTVVQVQWGYIAAPIVFMILCLLFFAATVIYQRTASTRTKTWKSSILAVLHALGPEMQGELGGMKTSSALLEQAEEHCARLVHSGNTGWRLKGRRATVT